jgi:hypothetical protein
MSKKLANRNRDVERLQEAGFSTEVRDAHLVVPGIPYVAPDRTVKFGSLVCVIDPTSEGGVTLGDHQVWFIGDHPCNLDGRPISGISHSSAKKELDEGLVVDHWFSTKPKGQRPYKDNVEKIQTYARIISAPAFELDPQKAKEPVVSEGSPLPPSPFVYPDTASARAGIVMISRKLSGQRIAIVGLGGTGSYILDQVAKTRVGEIHLFDGDEFKSHNAYRAPGAASLAEVTATPKKVVYFRDQYSIMHAHVHAHPYHIDATNVGELAGFDFVFLAMDTGPEKEAIVEFLEGASIPFVDTGLSVRAVEGSVTGIVRATASTDKVGDVRSRNRLSFRPLEEDNPYRQNVQLSELNALNAILAVMMWKKHFGFLADTKGGHHTTYTIAAHLLTCLDCHEPDDSTDA